MLEKRLNEWMEKVMASYYDDREDITPNTHLMIKEIDKIISEEFGQDPVFKENILY